MKSNAYLYISWGCLISCRASPAYSRNSPPRTQRTRRSFGCWKESGSWSSGRTLQTERKRNDGYDLLLDVRHVLSRAPPCLTFHWRPLGEDGDGALGHPLLLDHWRDLRAPAVRAHPQEVARQVVAFRSIQDSPVRVIGGRKSETRESV